VNRSEKEQHVAALNQLFDDVGLVVLTQYSGLTVAETNELRNRMREAGAGFKVAKNRLAKRALAGTPYSALADMFAGPTAIAYSNDPIAAARVSVGFAKDNDKLVIVGGAMGGQALDVAGVKALAALPSLDELRAKLIGLVQAPATKLAGVIQAPAGQLARVMAARGAQDEAA